MAEFREEDCEVWRQHGTDPGWRAKHKPTGIVIEAGHSWQEERPEGFLDGLRRVVERHWEDEAKRAEHDAKTPKENEAQKLAHGRRAIGEKQPKSVLTDDSVRWIREHYIAGDREFGASALARRFGLHNTTVLFAATGKTWKHVQ